jgi:hypothetical protein
MECPICGNRLTQSMAGEITVDVCAGGCGEYGSTATS